MKAQPKAKTVKDHMFDVMAKHATRVENEKSKRRDKKEGINGM